MVLSPYPRIPRIRCSSWAGGALQGSISMLDSISHLRFPELFGLAGSLKLMGFQRERDTCHNPRTFFWDEGWAPVWEWHQDKKKKKPSWNLQTESCTIQPILPGLTIPRNPADPFPLPLPESGTIPNPGSHGTPVTFFGIPHFLPVDQLQDGIGNGNYPNVDVCKLMDMLRILFLHHLDPPRVNLEPELHPPNPAPIFRDSMEPPRFPFTAEGVLHPLPAFFPHFPPPIFFPSGKSLSKCPESKNHQLKPPHYQGWNSTGRSSQLERRKKGFLNSLFLKFQADPAPRLLHP